MGDRIQRILTSVQTTSSNLRSNIKRPECCVLTNIIATLLGVITIGSLIIGLCCLLIPVQIKGTPSEKLPKNITVYTYRNVSSIEYSTKCKYFSTYYGKHIRCYQEPGICTCNENFEVPEFINGDVIIAYSLETFNQSKYVNSSKFYQSKDDNQLSGKLSTTVSELCEPYAYDNNRTIAPCGALANAMFTDEIQNIKLNESPVPKKKNLLREDEKKGFRNPENENLTAAFQNFVKPIDWTKNIWELDQESTENNGFQNEAFIVWMRNDLKIKPIWRLDRIGDYETGLPSGNYTITIDYVYPYSKYDGPRRLTLYQELAENVTRWISTDGVPDSQEPYNQGVGVLFIVIFFISLGPAVYLIYRIYKGGKKSLNNDRPKNNDKKKNEDSPKKDDRPKYKPPDPPLPNRIGEPSTPGQPVRPSGPGKHGDPGSGDPSAPPGLAPGPSTNRASKDDDHVIENLPTIRGTNEGRKSLSELIRKRMTAHIPKSVPSWPFLSTNRTSSGTSGTNKDGDSDSELIEKASSVQPVPPSRPSSTNSERHNLLKRQWLNKDTQPEPESLKHRASERATER